MSASDRGMAFHVHHDKLVEYAWSFKERVEYIKRAKPLEEQELRLRLFKLIPPDRLPPAFAKARAAWYKAGAAYAKAGADFDKAEAAWYKAGAAWNKARAAFAKARAAWNKAGAACDKARAAFDKAGADILPLLEDLHRELCPNCPFDGKTIFPNRKE